MTINFEWEYYNQRNQKQYIVKGYKYFGTYTFLIILEFALILLEATFVPNEKNEYNNLPHNMYNGNSLS